MAKVTIYSLKKEGEKQISQNFKVKEFRCKDGSDEVLIADELAELLQNIRDYFGKSVTINSGYRTPSYNKKIGGATRSQHVEGTAADIVVNGVTPLEVAQYAEYLMPNMGGIGLYSSFTHVDVRRNRARWKSFGKEVSVSGFPGFKEKPMETPTSIINALAKREIITDIPVWKQKMLSKNNAYYLAMKAANMTVNAKEKRKTELKTVNNIVWELNFRGIITDMPLWLRLLETDKNLYWLAYKIANFTVNKD